MTLTGLLLLSSGFILMALAVTPEIRHRISGLFYGWKLAGVGLLVTGLVSGPVWSGVGVWVKVLELDMGWSRTQLTGAFSLARLQGGLIGPFSGFLIDRLGPRRMVFIGLAVTGLGFILFSRATNLVTFYIAYTLIMVGANSGSWLPIMSVLNRWFDRKRTRAMSIAGEGDFVGGLLLVPVLAWAVTPGHLGWSTTAVWIGVIFLAVAWPISRFVRDRPEDYGQYADGVIPPHLQAHLSEGQRAVDDTAERNPPESDQLEFTARQAIRTSAFWLISFGHALTSMLIATMSVHFVPLLTDEGLSLQTAAYVWSTLMAAGAVFQPVGGYLGDRLPKGLVIFVFCTLQAAGFTLAAFAHSLPMAILAGVMYGAGFGGRDPITTSIRGDYFGRKAFATITGISMVPLFAFALGAPMFAATMFDAFGNYTLAFLILGGLGATSGVLFLFAKKPESITPTLEFGPVKVQA